MDYQSTIRAFQTVLSTWEFTPPESFSEDFAQARFRKKFEEPDPNREAVLAQKCWDDFIDGDSILPDKLNLPSGEWYRARLTLHSVLRGRVERHPVDFPSGSSFESTRGFNSIEPWLCQHRWTCTPENFNKFSRLVYNHKALKRAFRFRYSRWFQKQGFLESYRECDAYLWDRFKGQKDPGFAIFLWKLERVVTFVRGSRFSTVFKNNEKRRPINLEAFANLLTQRQTGNFLRHILLQHFNVDLDNLADVHRQRISDDTIATIDLKDASGNISHALCEFSLPEWFYKHLCDIASPMIFGHDGLYHIPKKISSMGCGFTFELMTLILTSIAREVDPNATVFGDDIIVTKSAAPRLIQLLQEVGLVVNEDKSFLEGPFRESCGGNYHDDEGYIESFDFIWPESIGDCAVILSKTKTLGDLYPSFSALYNQLLRRVPKALRGGLHRPWVNPDWDSPDLPCSFPVADLRQLPIPNSSILSRLKRDFSVSDVRVGVEFRYKVDLRSKQTPSLRHSRHWAKYEMYLASGRRSDDVSTLSGRWVKSKVYFLDGLPSRFPRDYLYPR